MNGANALIADNTNTGSGAWGAVSVGGTFNMHDGAITRNASSNLNANAIHFSDSDSGGVFNMHGGVIESNGNHRSGANAVFVSTGHTANIYGGVIRDQNGAGVSIVGGTVYMSGGRITENRGSGVHLWSGTDSELNISGTALIDDNSNAGNGGGVRAEGGTVNITGGRIEDNVATASGGGVYLRGTSSLNMPSGNGRIENNRATGTNPGVNGHGGGVFVGEDATLNMQTGTVIDNTAAQRGGAVFMAGPFTVAAADRLTTGAGTVFTGNAANEALNLNTDIGALNFPNIQWAGANSLGGALAGPVNPHLVNNFDIFWDHPFGTSDLTLTINGGNYGTASVSATDGTPGTVNTSGATMQVTPGNQVTVNAALGANYSPHSGWFSVTVTKTEAGGTPTTITLTGGSATFDMPSADAVVTVTFAPLEEMFISLAGADLFYGSHTAAILARTITLQYGHDNGGGTDPSTVDIVVFNGLNQDWHIEVSSESVPVSIGAGSCDVLASLMAVNGQSIHETGAGMSTIVYASNGNGLISHVGWNDLDYDGVVVEVPAGQVALGDGIARQAILHWTLVGGLPSA